MNPNRRAALVSGDRFFDPERPCQRGHHALRYAKGGVCVECARENSLLPQSLKAKEKWRARNPDYQEHWRQRQKEQKDAT
jgi:hypothetical protein